MQKNVEGLKPSCTRINMNAEVLPLFNTEKDNDRLVSETTTEPLQSVYHKVPMNFSSIKANCTSREVNFFVVYLFKDRPIIYQANNNRIAIPAEVASRALPTLITVNSTTEKQRCFLEFKK